MELLHHLQPQVITDKAKSCLMKKEKIIRSSTVGF